MRSPDLILRWTVICIFAGGLLAPSLSARENRQVDAIQAHSEIPEESLLDVGILVFDPGLPEDEEEVYDLEAKGVFEGVRKAEARYIPIQLQRTLESTGNWGAVRLVPAANRVDVKVSGRIVTSTGKTLVVKLRVVDARGRIWLNKKYKGKANVGAYRRKEGDRRDPFQSLYNRVANDMLKARDKKLDAEDFREVRMVSRLEFAGDLAPTIFADYLRVDKKGRRSIEKLPAENDPMMERIAEIRERDRMFVDTLNEHYADFYTKMDEPYDSWRSFAYEEQRELDSLKRKSKWAKILGTAAVIGGAVVAAKGGAGSFAGQAGIGGGIAAITYGMKQSGDIKMHLEAMRELGASLDTDVSPMVIEVEGEVMKLSGSVDAKYTTWRRLLREIFATETGIPIDPNTEVDAGAPSN